MSNQTSFPSALCRAKSLAGAALIGLFVISAARAQTTLPERIVAIGGAVTETLYALGVEDRIVAVDTTAVYPPEARQKPNVGYMRAISAEGVLAQSPDLMLIEEGAGPPNALALLEVSGVPIETVPDGHAIDSIGTKIEVIAKAVGKPDEGKALSEAIEHDLATLKDELGSIERKRRVLFVLSIVDGRPMAAGHDTAADAMMRLAGGVNVFGEIEGYKTISPESATELAPDVVVMMTGAGRDHQIRDPFAIPALAATPAGQANALIRMDAAYLLGFGPRTAQAARDLASRLYPGEIDAHALGAAD
ncbi:hemin ABC transporter substrate-binding protein [Aurantimonas sp. VKM B-3413]|uniref:heme/hemin ABC transporter substrate-binding protein n=1 Tax=Aurantimonas sp. VKM B-3413 TaxID=2779401 RepID=UPI001E583DBC|nr:ABC transporter substrate-binding protein [Aurantimonas sp. VKM B-3413]MCB8836710.1 ABC transporter substrate-binding protein [Aurantimonas sp. VKM B-3413]